MREEQSVSKTPPDTVRQAIKQQQSTIKVSQLILNITIMEVFE